MAHIGAQAYAVLLGGNPVAARHMRRCAAGLSPDYVEFVKVLSLDLTDIANLMQSNPQRRHKLGEDALTDEIVSTLSVAGYNASHDTSSGGHVDLTVKLGAHSWIGEAKKDKNYSEGYKQLVTRYRPGSGNFDHNHGGMLLYFTGTADVLSHRGTWLRKFTQDFKQVYTNFETMDCAYSQSAFFSTHKHPVSGRPFVVRHLVFGLQFHPQDASAMNSKKKAAAKASATSKPAVTVASTKSPKGRRQSTKVGP